MKLLIYLFKCNLINSKLTFSSSLFQLSIIKMARQACGLDTLINYFWDTLCSFINTYLVYYNSELRYCYLLVRTYNFNKTFGTHCGGINPITFLRATDIANLFLLPPSTFTLCIFFLMVFAIGRQRITDCKHLYSTPRYKKRIF